MIECTEFVERILKVLNEQEYERVLKIAASNGFTVNGFSKDITKAPISLVIRELNSRVKKKEQSKTSIIIRALASIPTDKNSGDYDKRPIEAGILWKEKIEDKKIRAIEILEELEKTRQKKEKNEVKNEEISDCKEIRNCENDDQMKQKLREKIKQLQYKLQGLKIENENINKKYTDLAKLYEKINSEKKDIIEERDKQLLNIASIQNDLDNEKELNKKMKEKITYLSKFEPDKLKILCFSKDNIDKQKFSTYEIDTVNWCSSNEIDNIEWSIYDRIWIITKDYTYNDICAISEKSQCKIEKYFNINKISGGEK